MKTLAAGNEVGEKNVQLHYDAECVWSAVSPVVIM